MPTRHIVLALLVAVVWGVNFVVIDVGLDAFPPLLFAALRFTLVAFPAVLFVRRPAVRWHWVVAVGTFLSAGQFGLLFVSMDLGMPAGLASLVLQLQAMFTIGLAVILLGERPGLLPLAGAAVALAGIGVIALGRTAEVPLLAIALCCGAGLSWAIGNISTRLAQAPDAISLLVWSSLIPPVPLGLLSLAFEDRGEVTRALTTFDAGGVLALAYVVIASTAFGFGAWTWLMRRYPASTVAPFTLLVPPVGISAAWVALGERPNGAELAGAALVLGGLALIVGAHRLRAARGMLGSRWPARRGSTSTRTT